MRYLIIVLALFSATTPVIACDAVRVLTGAYHVGNTTDLNNQVYGVFGECGSWTGGVYRNSEYNTSFSAYRTWRRGILSASLGVSTGYRSFPIMPIALVSVDIPITKSHAITVSAMPSYDVPADRWIGVLAVSVRLSID